MSIVTTDSANYTAIANAIRNKTGGADTYTPAQMAVAIAGIVSGGAVTGLAYDMGEFVFDADFTATLANSIAHPIPHNLGDIPEFVMVWSDNWVGNTDVIDAAYATAVGFMWLRELTGMTVRASSNVDMANPSLIMMTIPKGDYRLSYSMPTSALYAINIDYLTAESFCTPTLGTIYWRGGVTYKYFVSKAWWNIGGVASA